MTRGALVRLVLVGSIGTGGTAAQVDRQGNSQFRATTDVVLVPVSVKAGARPVPGLTAADFELLDQGVIQDVEVRMVESLPIDVTLVLDTSGSVRGRALEQFKSSVQRIAESLQVNDRVRLLTFAANVSDASGLQAGGIALDLDQIEGGGATSFYNALAAAVIAFPLAERPQFIFGFTDGADNMSFQNANGVSSLVARSGVALYLHVPGGVRSGPSGQADRALRDAAERSGGAFYGGGAGTGLPDVFARALTDFRTNYVLTYMAKGVKAPGWHTLSVRTRNPRYTVRARSGYDAE